MIKETGISLTEVLELKPLDSCKLLAGKSGLSNVITRVNIMADLEILNWIEEGEFLLTTAVHFGNLTIREQTDLIRGMKEKGVEAVAIKIQPYIDQLSSEVLALADEIALPIIQLDYSISFADVMEPILKVIFDKQSQIIKRAEAVHNDVMSLLLKGGNIFDVVKGLSEKINNSFFVKDYYFDELIVSDTLKEVSFNYDEIIDKFFKKNGIAIKNNKIRKYKIIIDEIEREVLIIPIIARSTVYGNAYIINTTSQISKTDIQMIESASSIIALELLKKISIQEIENKYRVEFFDDLISTDKIRKAKAIERSNYYKFDKDADYCTFTIALKPDKSTGNFEKIEVVNRLVSKIIYLVDGYCKSQDYVFLVANRKSQVNVVMMFKNKVDSTSESLNMSKSFENLISQKILNIKFVIGVGRVYRGIDNIYKSLNDAQKAVLASDYYVDDRIILFDDLGIYKIFCNTSLEEELYDFYSKTLLELVKYDTKKDTELVKTLRVYYEANGNLKKMSDILFTHYNTVLYRINRIQDITNTKLDNEKQRYGLQTAIKIMDMFGINNKN